MSLPELLIAVRDGGFRAAMPPLEQIAADSPGSPEADTALFALRECRYKLGLDSRDMAQRWIGSCVERRNALGEAVCRYCLGEVNTARRILEQGLATANNRLDSFVHGRALFLLAHCLFQGESYERATDLYSRARDLAVDANDRIGRYHDLVERRRRESQGQNRIGENPPSGIAGGLAETWPWESD